MILIIDNVDQSLGSLKLVVHRGAAPQQTLWVVDFLSEDINDQENCGYNSLIFFNDLYDVEIIGGEKGGGDHL